MIKHNALLKELKAEEVIKMAKLEDKFNHNYSVKVGIALFEQGFVSEGAGNVKVGNKIYNQAMLEVFGKDKLISRRRNFGYTGYKNEYVKKEK